MLGTFYHNFAFLSAEVGKVGRGEHSSGDTLESDMGTGLYLHIS